MANNAITPGELTDLFYRSGALNRGSVTEVRLDKRVNSIVSTLTFLFVTYSSDVSPPLPERLVFKQPPSQNGMPETSRRELDFYSRLASELPSPPVVPWYLTTSDGNLILQDLRPTHTTQPWPLPPSDAESLQMVETLAQIHARWWEDSALGVTLGSAHTDESLTSMVSGVAALLSGFCDALGDRLSVSERELLERVFASSLRPWLRLTEARGLTVTHGDAHSWNFLFPREAGGPVYLIDWQLWHVDVGTRDLAFLIALHWDAERRRVMEIPLLRKYHEDLIAGGIVDYSWGDLWLDYRLCVVRNLTIPVLFWSRGMADESWQHRLQCALASYDDLHCDDVL